MTIKKNAPKIWVVVRAGKVYEAHRTRKAALEAAWEGETVEGPYTLEASVEK